MCSSDLAAAGRGQGGGYGFSDQGLAASRRTVQEQPLGGAQAVGAVKVGVGERQFQGVADGLDLLSGLALAGPAETGILIR